MLTTSLSPGDAIGAYRVLSHIGSGGMGDVYLAEDARLGRRVALKTLPPALANDGDMLKRFEREARAASALNHPSILTIHDLGTDSGVTYIASEFVEGETLRQRMERAPLAIHETVDIATQVASALAVAHAAGIIHRDIKPDNIMIRRDGLVKVLDFGLAKLVGPTDQNADTELFKTTQVGGVIGTVNYMSPEQLRNQPLDGRSDIFSLGCVMYEMISGKGPFHRGNFSDVVAAVLTHDPAPPVHPSEPVPRWLSDLVMRALRKKVQDRWQSADMMVSALRDVTAEITARTPIRLPGRVSRRTMFAIAGVVVLVALTAWLAPLLMKPRTPPDRIRVAVADFDNQTGEKALDGLSGMLITSLEQSRRLRVMSRARMFDVLKGLGREEVTRIDERNGRDISRAANLSALVTASVNRFGDVYVIELKILDPATNEYLFAAKEQDRGQDKIPELIDRLSEKVRLGLDESVSDVREARTEVARATTPDLEAYGHYFRGEEHLNALRLAKAEEEFRAAVAIDPQFAMAWFRIAQVEEWFGRLAVAQNAIGRAKAAMGNLPAKEKLIIQSGEASARGDYNRAVALRKQVLEHAPEDKESLYIVGDYSYHAGRYDEAITYLRRVIELDPSFERAHQHLARAYRDAGRFPQFLQAATEWQERLHSAEAGLYKAEALLVNGRTADAVESARRVPDDGTSAAYFLLPAYIRLAADDVDGALHETQNASRPHERFAAAHVRAVAAVRRGRARDAIALYDEAIALAPSIPRATVKEMVMSEKARLLAQLGDAAGARAILSELVPLREKLEVDVFRNMAFAWYQLGDIAALESFAKVYSPGVESMRHFVAGHVALHRRDTQAAVAEFRRLAALYPYWYPLANAAYAARRYDEAADAARRAQSSSPTSFYGALDRALFKPTEDAIRATVRPHV